MSRRRRTNLGRTAPGTTGSQFPVHHGSPLPTIGEQYAEEHEQTANEAEYAEGILGLIGYVEVGDGMRGRGDGIHSIAKVVQAGRALADGTVEGGARLARGDEGPGGGIAYRRVRTGTVYSVTALEIFDCRIGIVQWCRGADALHAVLIAELIDGEGTVGGAADGQIVAVASRLAHG